MKTSVSVVDEDAPFEVKRKHEQEYQKYKMKSTLSSVKEPKFKLYLYDDKGKMIQVRSSKRSLTYT